MNWEDARFFLAVARDGRMLGAARKLGTSQARLSRQIAALELALGTSLLNRTTRGCSLTEDGMAMLEAVERAEAAMLDGAALVSGRCAEVSGTVRIGTPDGFGSAFLASRLHRFTSRWPELRVQLVPMPRSFSLSEREADLAIVVGRPDKGRLRVRRLTDYSLGIYTSEAYLARAGRPESLSELADHILIGYVEDLIPTTELTYTNEILRDWRSSIEVATAIGQFEALVGGAGIGVIHDFLAVGRPDLVRLFPDKAVTRTYWTVWHENMHAKRQIKAVVEMLDTLVQEESALFVPDR